MNLDNPGGISPDTLEKMVRVMRHRGPDGSGIYIDDYAGLGHARLSIIDIDGGSQPIHNEDENLWITYNGEVYNYTELRASLEKRGHVFYTATDTEVILHLYEDKGVNCLSELNGQFSMAIWDSKKHELFLARDRMGIRPLFYTWHKNTFIFASEIKSLFMVPEIIREIDSVAMEQVFTFWTTLPERTIFKNIKSLQPGQFLKISRSCVCMRKYWEIPLTARSQYKTESPEQLMDSIKELLTDAIRIRLRADVSVGSYLSGGLDSSGISSLIAKNFNNELNTFGISFENPVFDESKHQQRMVDDLKVAHHEVRAGNDDIGEVFQKVIWHAETPILRTAPSPLYLLSRLVREKGFKVVLTGEGADEVFCGYNIFRETLVRRFWSRGLDSPARAGLIEHLYPHIFKNPQLNGTLKRFFRQGISDTDNPLYSHLIRWNNTGRIKMFFSENLKIANKGYDCFGDVLNYLPDDFNKYDGLSKAQYLEMRLFLSNYLLSSQGDRVAMANSLEIRLPYLDHRIMEFMSQVPSIWKILGINEKHLLKKVFQGDLPSSITSRTKQPYRAPIHHSFFNKRGPAYVTEMLSDNAVKSAGLFDSKKISLLRKKAEMADNISEVDGMAIAGVLSTMLINYHFIENFPKANPKKYPFNIYVDRRTHSPSLS